MSTKNRYDAQTDEEKFLVLTGAIVGAYMANESGANAQTSLDAIWEVLQDLLGNTNEP